MQPYAKLDIRFGNSTDGYQNLIRRGFVGIGPKPKAAKSNNFCYTRTTNRGVVTLPHEHAMKELTEHPERPRAVQFVVTNPPYPTNTLCIALLSGTVDIPFGKRVSNIISLSDQGFPAGDIPGGEVLLMYKTLTSSISDITTYYTGVGLWRTLATRTEDQRLSSMLKALREMERERKSDAAAAEAVEFTHVLLVNSNTWGFDYWYQRRPIVVAWAEDRKRILVGARNGRTARKYFDQGIGAWLKENFGPRWHGQASFGGSPDDEEHTFQKATKVATLINDFIGE